MSDFTETKESKESKEVEIDLNVEPAFSLDAEDEDKIVILVSFDNERFSVTKKNACISKMISAVIENDPNATEISVPGCKGKVLETIVEYMVHHCGVPEKTIEKPLRSKHMKDVVSDKWDAEFIDKTGEDRQKLYDMILAANYMDITCLLHLGCAKVASMIKGQPLEKIKEILAVNQENKTDDAKPAEDKPNGAETSSSLSSPAVMAGPSEATSASSSSTDVTMHTS